MSDRSIVKRSAGDPRRGDTDWARVDALTDEQIQAAIDSDPDAAPELDAEFWKNAEWVRPLSKIPTSIRVDADVLEWFRGQGKGWQTRVNGLLRAYAEAHGLKR